MFHPPSKKVLNLVHVVLYAYAKTNQHTEAIEANQKALRIDPEYARAWYNLGIAHYSTNQQGKVIESYQRLKKIDSALADEFFNKFVLP